MTTQPVGGYRRTYLIGKAKPNALIGKNRETGEVFLITGCFAHEHQPGMCRPFAENRLGCVSKELASLASLSRGPKLLQAAGLGHK